LKNVVPGSLAPFQMNTFYFIYGITNLTLWWDLTFESTNKLTWKKSYKRGGKFCPHHSPYSNYLYFNKPKIVKKCKKGVNMTYHVYTITCKQNEKMYIGQSLNPTRRFKQHALNPPTKMIADVHNYRPLKECLELNFFFHV